MLLSCRHGTTETRMTLLARRCVGDELRALFLQAGLERAAEAAADPAAAHALRTAWLWLKRMEDRRYARREQEASRTPRRCIDSARCSDPALLG